MHGLIRDRLEDFLRGGSGRDVPAECAQHLRECNSCRDEVSWMQEQSRLLQTLAAQEAMDPPVGFYARVLERIDAEKPVSMWTALLDPVFGRRLAATSLALFMICGAYLAFNEAGTRPAAATAGITAFQERSPELGQDLQRDRDTTLVTLVTYRE
jgi:predicted anti-sigma-YlaC factor YlaD